MQDEEMPIDKYKLFMSKLIDQHTRGLITNRELSQQIAVLTLAFQKGGDY